MEETTTTTECNQCGFCCVMQPCPLELYVFGERKLEGVCPALHWEGDKAVCTAVEKIRAVGGDELVRLAGWGTGCDVSAKVWVRGVRFEFHELPDNMRIDLTQRVRTKQVPVVKLRT